MTDNKESITITLVVDVRDRKLGDFWKGTVSYQESRKKQPKFKDYAKLWRRVTICERIDLSLIDLKILLHVSLFLKPVQRKVLIILAIKWVRFFWWPHVWCFASLPHEKKNYKKKKPHNFIYHWRVVKSFKNIFIFKTQT